jgi:hypothetical protein
MDFIAVSGNFRETKIVIFKVVYLF